MADFTLVAQDVNGDPLVSGSNINITNGSTTTLIFQDVDNLLAAPVAGEFVSLDGGTTFLTYTFLGFGDVRGDPGQTGGFVRVDMGDGTFRTFAIDMNEDGDGAPTLANGNTKLQVANLDASGGQSFPVPPCFVSGTMILTQQGYRPVESLAPGDLVLTRDNGMQPVRWHGQRTVWGQGTFAPVRFEAGVLNNHAPLLVSPQHRMLITGWQAEMYFSEREVFVAAKDLVDGVSVRQVPSGLVTYHHILFDCHQVIQGDGAWSESFFPGPAILESNPGIRKELYALFPELMSMGGLPTQVLARRELTGKEAVLLREAA